MFLSLDELQTLCGCKRKDSMKRHLSQRGVQFHEDAHGYPKVLISAVEELYGVKKAERRTEPNFNYLRTAA